MLEYGDVFSTTAVSPSSSVWAQDRTVLGTRVLGFSCGPNSAAAAVVTEGIRLAAPGLGAATVERPRLDRDVVRWLRGQSAITGPEKDLAIDFKGTKVAIGADHCGLLTRDGSVFAWGTGAEGQIGAGKLAIVPEPLLLESLQRYNVVDIAFGGAHSVALLDDGSLYSWGRGHEGQTGLALPHATAAKHVDVTVSPRYVHALMKHPVGRISCGFKFTAAVTRSGQLWTWGEGGCGQLGIPKVSSLASPTCVAPVAPNDAGRWVDVACGWAHCVGLTHTRRVFTWGLNCKGQLGLGDMKARSKPCQVVDPCAPVVAASGTDSKLDDRHAVNASPLAEASSVLEPDHFVTESKLDYDDEADGDAVGEFSATLRRTTTAKSMALDQSIHDALSLPEVIPPPPSAPAPVVVWEYSDRELKATVIAAGKFHTAIVSDKGELFTWGSSEGGRLGLAYDEVAIAVSNGHSTFRFITPVICPRKVKHAAFSERIVSDVGCSDSATFAFSPTVVNACLPTSGFATGGKRVVLSGVGLASLAWVRKVGTHDAPIAGTSLIDVPDDDPNLVEEELGPGHIVIPDVYVRFTQLASDAPPPSRGASRAGFIASALIVKYVHAYSKIPSDESPDDHTVKCLSPIFGIEADACVEVIVGMLDGTQAVVRGNAKYTFFAAPTLTTVQPNCLPLSATKQRVTVSIGGVGLFGTMLADKLARPIAEALVNKVNNILEARDEEEARQLEHIRSGGVGPAPPVIVPPTPVSPTKAKAGTRTKDIAPSAPVVVEAPPAPGVTLFTSNVGSSAKAPAAFHEVRVRFLLLIDNKVKFTSAAVPGWYEGKYEEEVPEPLPVVDGSDDDDEKDDDIKTDIKSTYSATVSCEMPVIELTDAMIDAATVGPAADGSPAPAPAIAIRVEVSPNGDDFLRCAELVQSYVLKASSLSPSFAPVQGGTVMALRGRCLPNMASTALRIDVTVPGKPKPACLSFAAHCDYVNSETLTFLLPRLEVPEPAPAITPMSVAAGRSVDSLPALTAHSAPPILQELPEPDEPLRPLLPPGKYAARVFVALDGVTFEDTGLGFTAYSAQMGSISPLCGVLSGGTTVTFQPDVPTGAVKDWFIAGPDNAVRVYNDDFDVHVPCMYDAKLNAVTFAMPPLILPPEPVPMSGAGGDEAGAPAEQSVGSLDEAVSVTTQAAAVVTRTQKQVSIALAFVRGQYLLNAAPAVFSYYDEALLRVTSVTPASAAFGGKITVGVDGWEASDPAFISVRAQRLAEPATVAVLKFVVSDDHASFVFDVPTEAEGWAAGDAGISLTIDGQHWTSPTAEGAKFTTVPPGKKK